MRNVNRMQTTMTPLKRTRDPVKKKTWNRRFFVFHKKNINVITVNSNIIIASRRAVEAELSFSRNFLGIFTIHSFIVDCKLWRYFLVEFDHKRTRIHSENLWSCFQIALFLLTLLSDHRTHIRLKVFVNICDHEQVFDQNNKTMIFTSWTWTDCILRLIRP